MTEAEARIFLSMSVEDDPLDAIENALFEFKKGFISQSILLSIFHSKLNKLKKIEEAAIVFGYEQLGTISSIDLKLVESEDILEVFQSFQQIKSKIYLAIQSSYDAGEIRNLVGELMKIHSEYCSKWPEMQLEDINILLSKEPDPMDLLFELKNFREKGIVTFQDLKNTSSNDKSLLLIESQRLYLLNQKNQEWKMSF